MEFPIHGVSHTWCFPLAYEYHNTIVITIPYPPKKKPHSKISFLGPSLTIKLHIRKPSAVWASSIVLNLRALLLGGYDITVVSQASAHISISLFIVLDAYVM